MSKIEFVAGKYQTTINGKMVKRSKLAHLEYTMRKAGLDVKASPVASTPLSTVEVTKSEFSPVERFEFIGDFTKMIVDGDINSFVLTGSGGIGKTTQVANTLELAGLVEDTPDQPYGDYLVIKGFSTPRALYETLFTYKDRILILDDADDAFKDPTGANILKAALDDKETRVISWNSSREDSEVPNRFTYTGRVIFISNKHISQFPQAIVSRSQKVDVTLTTDEIVEIIEHVFEKRDDISAEVKSDVLEFVKENASEATDLNIRSATALITLRNKFGANKWKRIAKYSFCGCK
jgi:hypothetical protein